LEETAGIFTISLDFELFWGVRDKWTLADYGHNIRAVWQVVPKLLELFTKHGVHATWAAVGFIYLQSIDELLLHMPLTVPNYKKAELSPYNFLNSMQPISEEYLFAPDLIALIQKHASQGQEIGTHTYSHYYCLEEGQTVEDFRNDISQAISIAKSRGVNVKSLIFPRNQFNQDYLKVLKELGIRAFRGNENIWINRPASSSSHAVKVLFQRMGRLLDSYINIFGHNTYPLQACDTLDIYNIPSSRFLRPYSEKLKSLEGLKVKRIKDSMTYAAKNSQVFHLWWHPHEFAMNIGENSQILEEILAHYDHLALQYQMKSFNMGEITEILDRNNSNQL